MSIMTFYSNNKDWGLICGAWGDVLCSLSNLYLFNIKKIIYFGDMNSQQMVEFLSIQKNIEKVITINSYDIGLSYNDYAFGVLSDIVPRKTNADERVEQFLNLKKIDIKISNIFNASWDPDVNFLPVIQHKNLQLPDYINIWAENFIKSHYLSHFIIVNPYSLHSRRFDNHWQFTEQYLDWLISHENLTFIFVGTDYYPERFVNKPNVINLYKKTPSVMHVFALAQKATAIISASNSLSHWCNANDLNCIVMMNKEVSTCNNYYERILTSKNISKIWFDDSLNFGKLITLYTLNLTSTPYIKKSNRYFYIEDNLIDESSRSLYFLTNKISKMFDIKNIFKKMPSISSNDLNKVDEKSDSMYDFLYLISKNLNFDNVFDFNLGSSKAISVICYGSQNIKLVQYNHYNKSNSLYDHIDIDLKFLSERYRKRFFINQLNINSQFKFIFNYFFIDFSFDEVDFKKYIEKIFLNKPKLLIIYNYNEESNKLKILKSWSRIIKKDIYICEFNKNILLIDFTAGHELIEKLNSITKVNKLIS